MEEVLKGWGMWVRYGRFAGVLRVTVVDCLEHALAFKRWLL